MRSWILIESCQGMYFGTDVNMRPSYVKVVWVTRWLSLFRTQVYSLHNETNYFYMSSNISKVFLTSYFLPALEKWRSQDWSSKLLFFYFLFFGFPSPETAGVLYSPLPFSPFVIPLSSSSIPPSFPSFHCFFETRVSLYKPRLPQTQNSPASTITCWYYRSMPPCQLADFFFLNKRLFFWLSSQNNADLFIARQCQLNECIPTSSESTNCSEHFWHLKSSQELSTSVLVYLKLLRMYSHSLLPQSVPPTTSRSVLFEMHKTIIWALDNPSLTTDFTVTNQS